jgi:hypothetical protein
MGIGTIPDACLARLGDRKDLGVHTEMFSNGLLDLYKKGENGRNVLAAFVLFNLSLRVISFRFVCLFSSRL